LTIWEKRALKSFLELLIAHILKIKYWETEKKRNTTHWKVEIVNFRNQINWLLQESPSLNQYIKEIYPQVFTTTVKTWKIEFDIPDDNFVPFETIMLENFFG
jgi:Domain of unknown function DUF29